MEGTAVYLYCVVHAVDVPRAARAPLGLPGADRPTIVPVARSLWLVTAVVSLDVYGPGVLEESLRDVDWVTRVAVAHEGVVEYFARRPRSTVIPMKLFTMFSSIERAVEETRARRQELESVVKRIAGCEEWGVRITRLSDSASRARARTSSAASGTEFLAERKAARDAVRHSAEASSAAAETAYITLATFARDARRRSDTPAGAMSPPLLDAAFLVPSARRSRFKAAVRKLADASGTGTQVVLTGPWPSYNFIQSGSRS